MGLPRSEYRTYIRSAAWGAVKARYRASKLPQCCAVCGDPQFDLHHRTYKRLGSERLSDLVPLCRKHHDAVHDAHHASGKDLWSSTRRSIKRMKR